MEKIERKPLKDIPSLMQYEQTLINYCNECKAGTRKWRSNGKLYLNLRDELKRITNGHCSFCDSFPLKVSSNETIEHYYPKVPFSNKTYEWENLYYCCFQCQTDASTIAFEVTIQPDSSDYHFEKYFYFDPQSGKINVMENLKKSNPNLFEKAQKFLIRYGINKHPERCQTRKTLYEDMIVLLCSNKNIRIDERPFQLRERIVSAV